MNSNFRTIPVLDGNGDQLTLFEFREPPVFFGLVRKKRFQLCTGELVEREGRVFVVASTGERLTRVRSGG